MMIKKKKAPQQPPQWFKEFADRQEKHWTKQLEFNESIVKRLDNLVSKNNLKE